MEKFTRHTGVLAAMDRVDVDTDQIIPKNFLKSIYRTGYGKNLFNDWRYLPDGSPNPDFELNRPEYAGASILVAGRNFGCGSSREHAPWALLEYGFRAVISSSFADIFRNNCYQNGLLPVLLTDAEVHHLLRFGQDQAGASITVDLEKEQVEAPDGFTASFTVDPFRRHCLLNGLDDIGRTLQKADKIAAFEATRPAWLPKIAV